MPEKNNNSLYAVKNNLNFTKKKEKEKEKVSQYSVKTHFGKNLLKVIADGKGGDALIKLAQKRRVK